MSEFVSPLLLPAQQVFERQERQGDGSFVCPLDKRPVLKGRQSDGSFIFLGRQGDGSFVFFRQRDGSFVSKELFSFLRDIIPLRICRAPYPLYIKYFFILTCFIRKFRPAGRRGGMKAFHEGL